MDPAGPPPEGRGSYGWRVVAALAITQTVSWGVLYYAFAVLLVPMAAELDASAAAVTGAYSLMLLVTGVAAVPVGWWTDRRGAHGLMTAGSVAAVALVVAWSQVTTLWQLYLVLVGIGLVSAAVLYEPAFAVVLRWFAARRAQALLSLTVVAGFASTIFLPLTDRLVAALGWRGALLVLAAVLAATTVAPHALVLRRQPPAPGGGPAGRAPRTLRETSRWAVRDRRFRWLSLAFTAHTLAIIVVTVHLVPYLREQGHSPAFAATATGALGALSVAGRLVSTGAWRRWPVGVVTATAFAAQAVAAALLLVAGASTAGAVTFVLLFGLGFGVGTLARPAMLADAWGTVEFATLSAVLGVALTAVKTLGPVLAGLLRTTTGSYQPVLLLLTGTAAVSAAALLRTHALPPHDPGHQPAHRQRAPAR